MTEGDFYDVKAMLFVRFFYIISCYYHFYGKQRVFIHRATTILQRKKGLSCGRKQ